MTSKQLILSAAILSLVITAGAISYSKAGERGDKSGNPSIVQQHKGWMKGGIKNHKQMTGAFNEVREAIENGDYQAWADLMNERPNANELINEETFAKLQEMHELMQAGDKDAAKKIADDLGVQRFGKKGAANQQFQAIKEAITNKDYEAWAELMGELPRYEGEIDQATFDKHVELNELTQRIKVLKEELGLIKPGIHEGSKGGHMPWRGHGFGPKDQ
jgi:Spy/CpxP family protein refolding chaperone